MVWRKNCLVIECLARANVTEAMTALMGRTNSTVPQVEIYILHLKIEHFYQFYHAFKTESFPNWTAVSQRERCFQ
jgi:hypothetical protein